MPKNIVQFQVVPLEHGGHTIYALDQEGQLWVKPGGSGMPQRWMRAE